MALEVLKTYSELDLEIALARRVKAVCEAAGLSLRKESNTRENDGLSPYRTFARAYRQHKTKDLRRAYSG